MSMLVLTDGGVTVSLVSYDVVHDPVLFEVLRYCSSVIHIHHIIFELTVSTKYPPTMGERARSPKATQNTLTTTTSSGETDVDRVLDLTFLDIRDESEFTTALSDKIQQYRARSPPRRPASPSATGIMGDMTGTSSPTKEKSRYSVTDRRKIRAIRLGNNYIERMDILFSASQFLKSENILWLDLSFNNITKLSGDLARFFPNVRTIYLHANQISSLPEIKKFENLTELHSLTLYGNPVEGRKHYRNYTLYHCSKLQQLDKSPVTSQQRQKMEVWAQTFRKKLHPEEDED